MESPSTCVGLSSSLCGRTSSACRNCTLVAENTPLSVPGARSVTANGPAADRLALSSSRLTLFRWKKKSRSRLTLWARWTAMAVPPPRYVADGTSGAMVSHVDAVSGGRMPRTRSDSTRIPGQVVCERTLRWLKTAGCGRMFPGTGGKIVSTPGKAIWVERREQTPCDVWR